MSSKMYVECPDCGNDVSVELIEHDKQIRADAINDFMKILCDDCIRKKDCNKKDCWQWNKGEELKEQK